MEHAYKKLKVWEMAHQWVLGIYECTRHFSKDERFGLTSQLRRAAVSIPTNVAEGCGRKTSRDTSHFLQVSIASCNEAEYLVYLARDLHYLTAEKASRLIQELVSIRKQLCAFQKSIESRQAAS